MHIIILGGGIVGITTAWELVQDGHEVSLLDAQPSLAQGTSFANGGQIAVGESGPWSTPDLLYKLWQQIGAPYPPFRLRLRASFRQWCWLLSFLRNCLPSRYAQAVKRNWGLATYSQQCLAATRTQLGNVFGYDAQARGILQLFASKRSFAAARTQAQILRDNTGAVLDVLPPAACIRHEPALAHAFDQGLFVGGVLTPQDESGDARLFAHGLGQALAGKMALHLGVQALGLEVEAGRVKGVRTPHGIQRADAVVIALGCDSAAFLRPYGIRLPIVPLKGYSLTLDNVNGGAPTASLTDYGQRLVISRLGERLRVAGYAELGIGDGLERRRVEGLQTRMAQLFPEAGDYTQAQPWYGFRPMSSDGAPFIGVANKRTAPKNLFVNTGHGSLGWTFAHGSARLLADMMAQRQPAIDPAPFAVGR